MTKRQIFWISLVPTIISVLLVLLTDSLYDICIARGYCWGLWDFLEVVGPIILLFPIIFLFSLLTYKLHDEIFRSWLRFAYWWVPLSIVVTLILSVGSQGGGFGMPNLLPAEGVVAFFEGVFFIISLIIIIQKYFATRGSK
jgi:hypothetical protein